MYRKATLCPPIFHINFRGPLIKQFPKGDIYLLMLILDAEGPQVTDVLCCKGGGDAVRPTSLGNYVEHPCGFSKSLMRSQELKTLLLIWVRDSCWSFTVMMPGECCRLSGSIVTQFISCYCTRRDFWSVQCNLFIMYLASRVWRLLTGIGGPASKAQVPHLQPPGWGSGGLRRAPHFCWTSAVGK